MAFKTLRLTAALLIGLALLRSTSASTIQPPRIYFSETFSKDFKFATIKLPAIPRASLQLKGVGKLYVTIHDSISGELFSSFKYLAPPSKFKIYDLWGQVPGFVEAPLKTTISIKIDNPDHKSSIKARIIDSQTTIVRSQGQQFYGHMAFNWQDERQNIVRREDNLGLKDDSLSNSSLTATKYNIVDYGLTEAKDMFLDHLHHGQIIGTGSYGIVAKGFDAKLKKQVAVKIMQKKRIINLPNGPQNIENELLVNQKLPNHPSIIKFHKWYDYPDSIYVELELFSHPSLGKFLNKYHPGEEEFKPIVKKIIEGLMALQNHGIYHQDIKPDNILYDQTTGDLKIIDFGLATLSNDPVNTRFEILMATSSSYEVALNKAYLPVQADIWQIGSLIYECASGGEIAFRPWTNIDYRESKWKKAYTEMVSLTDDLQKSMAPFFFPHEKIRKVTRSRMEIARLDVINLRYYMNDYWSEELKSLIRGIFQPVEKRLTLAEIYDHPWFK